MCSGAEPITLLGLRYILHKHNGTLVLPLLLTLQQFPIGVDLHVQGQFDIQQLLILFQLLLHLGSYLCDLALFISQHLTAQILLMSQSSLQVTDAILPASCLLMVMTQVRRRE